MTKNILKNLALTSSILVSLVFVGQPAQAGDSVTISDIQATAWMDTEIITWTTDIMASGTLQYGTVSGTYTETMNTDSNTTHYIQLTSLTPGTTYYYKISVETIEGATDESAELSFTTQSKDLSLLSSEVVIKGPDKIVIKTTSNKWVAVKIKYGTSTNALTKESSSYNDFSGGGSCTGGPENYNLLKGLKPNTVYYYQITLNEQSSRCGTVATKTFSVKQVKTTGLPIITSITPSSGKIGTKITIKGKNFDQGLTKGHRPIDAVVAFGCPLNNWLATASNVPKIKCLGRIESWSDSKIIATMLKSATTGPVYIGKAFTGDQPSLSASYLKMFVLKGPKFTVKK